MKIETRPLTIGDISTVEITIENSYKMKVSFLTYCGIITNFEVPDVNGRYSNIFISPKDVSEYRHSINYGNLITLYQDTSSISKKKEYIYLQDISDDLFIKQNNIEYEFEIVREKNSICVILKEQTEYYEKNTISKIIKYSLDEENNFLIDYEVIPQKDTYLNILNNFSFNLSAEGMKKDNILKHKLRMPADYYYTFCEKKQYIKKEKVNKTHFDFSELKTLGSGVYSDYGRIHKEKIYNTLFEFSGDDLNATISIYDELSKRLINITTDNKHIFMSSNNHITSKKDYKNQYITMRFYNLLYDDDKNDLELQFIEKNKRYKKFVNYNFKLM